MGLQMAKNKLDWILRFTNLGWGWGLKLLPSRHRIRFFEGGVGRVGELLSG